MEQDIIEPGYFYHIYNRGNNKENIFIEERNYYYFLLLIKKYLLTIADIYSYCLLKNHFHFLVRIKDTELIDKNVKNLHQPFSNLFNAYSKAINKMYNRTGSLFQEHLHRNRVISVDYLIQLIVYIHLNPVKHQFTDDYKNYKFSSYKSILSDSSTNIARDFVIKLFEDRKNFEYWHDFKKIKYEGIIGQIDKVDED